MQNAVYSADLFFRNPRERKNRNLRELYKP